MSFENLPTDWPTRSLSDPTLAADVVDLTLNSADRRRTSVGLLLCDDRHRLLQPMVINDIGHCSAAEQRHLFQTVCNAMPGIGASSLVVTLARPVGTALTATDRAWLESAREVCASRKVSLIGTFLADLEVVCRAA